MHRTISFSAYVDLQDTPSSAQKQNKNGGIKYHTYLFFIPHSLFYHLKLRLHFFFVLSLTSLPSEAFPSSSVSLSLPLSSSLLYTSRLFHYLLTLIICHSSQVSLMYIYLFIFVYLLLTLSTYAHSLTHILVLTF